VQQLIRASQACTFRTWIRPDRCADARWSSTAFLQCGCSMEIVVSTAFARSSASSSNVSATARGAQTARERTHSCIQPYRVQCLRHWENMKYFCPNLFILCPPSKRKHCRRSLRMRSQNLTTYLTPRPILTMIYTILDDRPRVPTASKNTRYTLLVCYYFLENARCLVRSVTATLRVCEIAQHNFRRGILLCPFCNL
jgi:hypothetical protein